MPRKITEEEAIEMVTRQQRGELTILECAKEYGIGKTSVSNYIAKYKDQVEPPPATPPTNAPPTVAGIKEMSLERLRDVSVQMLDKIDDTTILLTSKVQGQQRYATAKTLVMLIERQEKLIDHLDRLERQTGNAPLIRIVKPDRKDRVVEMVDVTKEQPAERPNDREGTNDK